MANEPQTQVTGVGTGPRGRSAETQLTPTQRARRNCLIDGKHVTGPMWVDRALSASETRNPHELEGWIAIKQTGDEGTPNPGTGKVHQWARGEGLPHLAFVASFNEWYPDSAEPFEYAFLELVDDEAPSRNVWHGIFKTFPRDIRQFLYDMRFADDDPRPLRIDLERLALIRSRVDPTALACFMGMALEARWRKDEVITALMVREIACLYTNLAVVLPIRHANALLWPRIVDRFVLPPTEHSHEPVSEEEYLEYWLVPVRLLIYVLVRRGLLDPSIEAKKRFLAQAFNPLSPDLDSLEITRQVLRTSHWTSAEEVDEEPLRSLLQRANTAADEGPWSAPARTAALTGAIGQPDRHTQLRAPDIPAERADED